jgi:hypothetical protein
MFAALMQATTISLSPDHAERVRSLSAALQEVRFEPPEHVDEVRVHVLGLEHAASPLPLDVDRSLIISPFVSTDFFARVRPAALDELVSRPESLDALGADVLSRIGFVQAFDDGSNSDFGAVTDRLSPRDPGRPLVGLHAKVFAFEQHGRARVFMGSANATGAAFESNLEILIELTGSIEHLGIDRLCAGNADEAGLRSLFMPYSTSEPPPDGKPTALDRGRGALAGLLIEGYVEPSGTGWAVTYRSKESVRSVAETTIDCWPLPSPGNRRRVSTGKPLNERFETTIETISGFLAFELAQEDGTMTQFVMPVPLHGVPEQRDRVLLRALIGNAERFFRYLLALLDDQPTIESVQLLADGGSGDGWVAGSGGLPVLEKLMRTMRRDPAKLAALDPLVSDLAADDALPQGFAELWETIFEVAIDGGRH